MLQDKQGANGDRFILYVIYNTGALRKIFSEDLNLCTSDLLLVYTQYSLGYRLFSSN